MEFFGNAPLPPPLLLSFDKLYRVLTTRPYSAEESVWTKADVGKDVGRKYVFSIHDDAGAPFEIGLHLDDPDVRYFTHWDVEQLLSHAGRNEG